MSDNSPKQKIAGIKQAWANPKARKGFLLAGGILVAVAAVAISMAGNQKKGPIQPSSNVSVAPPPGGARDVTADTNDQYKDLVRDLDKDRVQSVKNDPTAVVMPTFSGMDNVESQRRREAEEAAERGRLAALQQARANQNDFQTITQVTGVATRDIEAEERLVYERARNTPEYRATQQFMQALTMPVVQSSFTPIRPPAINTNVAGQNATGAATAQANTAGNRAREAETQQALAAASSLTNKPIIRAGEIVFATLDTAINSDYSGPVVATVRQGKFAGYRVVGNKSLERDAVVIRFSVVSDPLGNGQFTTNAYAVSLGDAKQFGLTGLAAERDYHVFERYVLPAAAAFASSYGLSANQKGTTAVVGEGGSVATTTPGMTSKDRVQAALGGAMAPILADVARGSARPITVSLPAQTEVGVMFVNDVVPASGTRQSYMGVPEQSAGATPR